MRSESEAKASLPYHRESPAQGSTNHATLLTGHSRHARRIGGGCSGRLTAPILGAGACLTRPLGSLQTHLLGEGRVDQRSIPAKGGGESGLKISSAVSCSSLARPRVPGSLAFCRKNSVPTGRMGRHDLCLASASFCVGFRFQAGTDGTYVGYERGGECQPRSIVTSPSPGGADRLPAPPLASLDS